jgi:hypothetical protein
VLNQAEQQTEKRKEWTHVGAEFSLGFWSARSTQELLLYRLGPPPFLSFSMIGDKFVLRYENFAAVFGFSV